MSWRVAAPGTRQEGGTDVEEGGARSLQGQCGIGDPVWTIERWSQGKKGRNEYKASNPEGEKQEQIGRIAGFCFHYCYYVSSWISCYAYTVLLYANV